MKENFLNESQLGKEVQKEKAEYADWSILGKESSPDMSKGGNDFIWGPAWEITVERNGIKKVVSVTEEDYNKYNVGEKVNLKLEYYEKEGYIEGIRNKIKEVNDFDSLEKLVRSIGTLKGFNCFYPLDDMLEDIKLMEKGKEARSYYFNMMHDEYGFREKANKLREDIINKNKGHKFF